MSPQFLRVVRPRKQIAARLGVREDSGGDHIEAIWKRGDVGRRILASENADISVDVAPLSPKILVVQFTR